MRKPVTLLLACAMLSCVTTTASAQLWQGKGRIAISSDGNEHDHDDWAATPLSLALLASQGLQDKVVLYTYSDHIWGSNQAQGKRHAVSAYDNMHESALGGKKWFGFDKTDFFCAVDNAEIAYKKMSNAINASTAANPLIIIAAGPMQVVGEALNRSKKEAREHVTVLSHSQWNNRHSGHPTDNYWDVHDGWTFDKMREAFECAEGGSVKFVQIADQNGGKDFHGFNAPRELFDWIKTSPARENPAYTPGSWDWLYSRLETCIKSQGKNFDPSDAGMVVYLLLGEEKTEPDMARQLMENPIR